MMHPHNFKVSADVKSVVKMLETGPVSVGDVVLTQNIGEDSALRILRWLGAEKVHGKYILYKTQAIENYLRRLPGPKFKEDLIKLFGPESKSTIDRKLLMLEKEGVIARIKIVPPARRKHCPDYSRGPRVVIVQTEPGNDHIPAYNKAAIEILLKLPDEGATWPQLREITGFSDNVTQDALKYLEAEGVIESVKLHWNGYKTPKILFRRRAA